MDPPAARDREPQPFFPSDRRRGYTPPVARQHDTAETRTRRALPRVTVLALGALGALGALLSACTPLPRVRDVSASSASSIPRPTSASHETAFAPPPSDSSADVSEEDHERPAIAPMDEPGAGPGPARRYAALDQASCEAELHRREIPFEREGDSRGVLAPVRLRGPIGGVDFHSMLPAKQRKTSPYEVYDCRLVLALDDFAPILRREGIVEVVHYSVYRPPSARAVPDGTLGRRHGGALAIDLATFRTKDDKTIDVLKDFRGRIGQKTCGPSAASPASLTPEAATLRRIVCAAADARLFNVLLTPHYNRAHKNHFHFELTAGVAWILVR